jgi:putative hemolysin
MPNAPAIPGDPLALHIALETRLARAAFAAARPFISRLLGLTLCRELYTAVSSAHLPPAAAGETFEARVLDILGIRFEVTFCERASIPPAGALIVAANHPTGAADGLVLVEAVRQTRPDVRILTNHLLARIPELSESCFFVDPFGGSAAAARSQQGLRAAHLWLRRGGALVLFPAGEVAWRRSPGGPRLDSPWQSTIGRLALATNASVLPVFLTGRNSTLFYAAGAIHPMLRTALLARELLNRRGTTTRVVVGTRIDRDRLRAARTPDAATALVRSEVEALGPASQPSRAAPIAPAGDPRRLAAEINALPPDTRLLSSGCFDVYCVESTAIPGVLGEIGRLREIAFRAVGEGTGRSADVDRFDGHYRHLFVWNRAKREIAGSYRVGATDRIVREHGVAGLYTRTLFLYDERLMHRMSPALELGRSFVRPEYQRTSNVLLLLWKGIGTLVAREPRYRYLFGPVSISRRYQDVSQQHLRAFLLEHHLESALADLVVPMNPTPALAPPPRHSPAVAAVDELDALLRRLEQGTGIPVLLRQYLRLGATLLGFNVDPAFGDALDALMMVDLTRLSPALLRRYIGRTQADAFLAFHQGAAA